MSLLTDKEKDELSIRRMIFHVVGKALEEPILLKEITPPEHTDFFLERVKSALRGNLFEFKKQSNAESVLRLILEETDAFAKHTQSLAKDFQRLHLSRSMSVGAFFVFELSIGSEERVFALIKYDNDDVVRYFLENTDGPQVPRLERFRESFVRKAEAMQKIALVRLKDGQGGTVVVRDRSEPTHISDYFQAFLEVRRVHSLADMSQNVVDAFRQAFKAHRAELPHNIQKSGVSHIYSVLRQGGHRFDPENPEPLITAIFGPTTDDSPIRSTLKKKLKDLGIADETFDIDPKQIPTPRRQRMETAEGTHIIFDEDNRPATRLHNDGRRTEIIIVTTEIVRDDVDTEKNSRSG